MTPSVRETIRAMSGYTPGEQPRDVLLQDIIKLNTNENPYPPSPRVFEAVRCMDEVLVANLVSPA